MEQHSDAQLIRYLLGELADADAERLDELSVTDDAIALRLRALEDDLVDRYARGEPRRSSLERFEQVGRDSAYLREKVRFAEALNAVVQRPGAVERGSSSASAAGPLFWALAAAAALAIVVSGYLLLTNLRLRSDVHRLEAQQAAAEQLNTQVQRPLGDARAPGVTPPAPVTATFLLRPPRRSASSDAATIAIPKNATEVALRLQVEATDYVQFWAELNDVSTGRIVWRSADLPPEPAGADSIVTMVVPVTILRAQRYAIGLSGISRHGTSEPLGEYLLRVVLQ